jgi:hypothetical protein
MTTDAHVSVLMLDALALGALDRDTADHIRAHLVSCAACREDQHTAAELREHFARSVLPRGLPVRRPRRWPWLAVPVLAAVVVVVVLIIAAQRPEQPPELAIKGDAGWQVFANRDGKTFAVHDGTELAAGDQIRFIVLPARAHYLLVASVDGSGAVMIYYPYGGEQSMTVEGDRVELSGSIELDAAPGPERIYALLSDDPITAAIVEAHLRDVAAGGAEAIRGTHALPVPARAQLSLVFEKARP